MDDLATVMHMDIAPSAEEEDTQEEEAQWVELGLTEDDGPAVAFVAIEDAQAIESVLANNAFFHGATDVHDMTAALSVFHFHL